MSHPSHHPREQLNIIVIGATFRYIFGWASPAFPKEWEQNPVNCLIPITTQDPVAPDEILNLIFCKCRSDCSTAYSLALSLEWYLNIQQTYGRRWRKWGEELLLLPSSIDMNKPKSTTQAGCLEKRLIRGNLCNFYLNVIVMSRRTSTLPLKTNTIMKEPCFNKHEYKFLQAMLWLIYPSTSLSTSW